MQKYSKTSQNSNIFKQIAAWRANRAKTLSEAEVNQAAAVRSDKTNADEAKIWVSLVLAVVTVITAFLAMMYYQDAFLHSFTSAFAWILAAGLAIVVEIGKIKLLLRALHSVLFSWMFQSWASLGYWSFIWLMAGGAFWWSVKVSTDGLSIFSKNHAEATVSRDSLAPLLAAATADIDKRIDAENASRADAQANKWKGTTVFVSSKQAKTNTANISGLLAQRDTIMQQVLTDYKASQNRRGQKIDGFTVFIKQFGGYMEVVSFLCIMAIGFFNRRLVDVAVEENALPEDAANEEPAQTQPHTTHSPTPRPAVNGSHVNNYKYPGFNVGNDGNVIAANPVNPPSTVYYNVVQENAPKEAIGADAIIQRNQSRITIELANLNKGNGKASTVARRIYDAIEEIGRGMESSGFKPSAEVATKCYIFMRERVFPTLLEHSRRYEYEEPFMSRLVKYVDSKLMAELV